MIGAVSALLLASASPAHASCGADSGRVCTLDLAYSPAALDALLGASTEAWWINDDIVTVAARRAEAARLCCALQFPLRRVAEDLHVVAVRVPDLHTAVLDMIVLPPISSLQPPATWRGPGAPGVPPGARDRSSRWERHEIASSHLGQTRTVSVALPADVETMTDVPVIYLADGRSDTFAGIARALADRGEAAPVVIVAIDSAPTRMGCGPQCDPRSQEYLPVIPGAQPEEQRFDAHARFVLGEVIPFIESRYPVARATQGRALAGYSSGGTWALTMAARYPETFGSAIAMSVGRPEALDEAGRFRQGRLFLGAGLLEPRFLHYSREAAAVARSAGAHTRLVTYNAGHSPDLWDLLFAEALPWIFPPH